MPLTKVQAGMVEATGTASSTTFLRGDGAWATPVSITSGTAVTASGTSVDFTGIPAGVKRITVMFSGVSTNGTSNTLIQVGAGAITSSGYTGAYGIYGNTNNTGFAASSTSGFDIRNNSASSLIYGNLVLLNITGNTWLGTGVFSITGATYAQQISANIALSGTLDRVRITNSNGTDTFDAGTINIMYET